MAARPCNGTELARRLGMKVNVENTERFVRPLLNKFGCPKKYPHYSRAPFVGDEAMARRVAEALGRRFADGAGPADTSTRSLGLGCVTTFAGERCIDPRTGGRHRRGELLALLFE